MIAKTFTHNYTIPCYDTDAAWRLKPTSFMNLAQEAAGNHAVLLGFGYDDLIKTNTAWILSRMHIKFLDTPKWRDQVTLTTWHKGLNRLFYLRDFIMTDAQGNAIIKATTSWLVLNLETRRLVRDPELMDEGTVNAEHVLETPADKVQMPKDIVPEMVMEHIVSYSDVDANAHANNAMYMQWAMDAVEYEMTSAHQVRELTINFNHETKAGDLVKIYRAVAEKEDGIHVFVEGKVEDISSFTVELVF
jgi:acyl-ACP thioesterase